MLNDTEQNKDFTAMEHRESEGAEDGEGGEYIDNEERESKRDCVVLINKDKKEGEIE